MALSGNKGEWSEVYVVLKLLAEGKLFSADSNLNKIAGTFNPIIKIIREQAQNSTIEYLINGNIKVVEANTKNVLVELATSVFIREAKKLFKSIKQGKGNAFSISAVESFLQSISITQLKTKSVEKADIILVIHDTNTATTPKLSFSIKSLIGKEPTLLNPGPGTNFIYKIIPSNGGKSIDVAKFNKATIAKPKITNRINKLISDGYSIQFKTIQSENFLLNLQLLDGDLPRILAELLLIKYKYSKSKTKELLSLVEQINPLNYDLGKGHPFYKYKLTSLLYDYALGMTPEVVWKGQYNANGGIIVAKNDEDVICYHIYDRNLFQDYLVNNTKFEQASTGEDESNPGKPRTKKGTKTYHYGWLYEESGEYYLKLNLQIRFI
ncbi:HpaII family restriction endonuclease [Lacibacter sp. H407]|uniref:HpaII family restriction endonuclease n=1 Tax=Lacibacter sp. H407 TaxID=3133423 RepID=UPI0030BAD729